MFEKKRKLLRDRDPQAPDWCVWLLKELFENPELKMRDIRKAVEIEQMLDDALWRFRLPPY